MLIWESERNASLQRDLPARIGRSRISTPNRAYLTARRFGGYSPGDSCSGEARLGAALAMLFVSALSGSPEAASVEPGPVLRGLDLSLTFSETSGLFFAPESYENQLSWIGAPSYALGKAWFPGTWLEALSLRGEIGLSTELAGSDASYRSPYYPSRELFQQVPERYEIAQAAARGTYAAPGRVDGTARRAIWSDLSLTASHQRLWVVPRVGIDLFADARAILPTSSASRNSGLQAATSVLLGATKGLGRFEGAYGFRAAKFFYRSTTAPFVHLNDPVVVNGQEVVPYQPQGSGAANPNVGVTHSVSLSTKLPRELSLHVEYSISHAYLHELPSCRVDSIPTADVCRDGAALGAVTRPAQHDSESFSLGLDWSALSFLDLGVGLTTSQPVRKANGWLANPFVAVNAENPSLVYLSMSVSAEGAASQIWRK